MFQKEIGHLIILSKMKTQYEEEAKEERIEL